MITLNQGFIFTSMLLAAMTACLIDRHYKAATGWALVAALLSFSGIIHGYEITPNAIINAYGPSAAWPFTVGYLVAALLFWLLGRHAAGRALVRNQGNT
jgi:AGZA family xanthine/uracil permease-like MFS transporter